MTSIRSHFSSLRQKRDRDLKLRQKSLAHYFRTLLIQGAQVILLRPANWARHSFAPVAYGRGEAAASPCFGNRARQQARPHGVDDLGQTRRKEPRTWRITRHIV